MPLASVACNGKDLEIVKEIERYELDVFELTFKDTLGSSSQLFERGWTLLFLERLDQGELGPLGRTIDPPY